MAAEVVSVTEIAAMLGVSHQRASQIIDAYDDFPEPAVVMGSRRGWDRTAVERWIRKHPERRSGRPRQAREEKE